MTEQPKDKVREPLLKADGGALSGEETDGPAEGTRRIGEQEYRKRHDRAQTHTGGRQKQEPVNRRRHFGGVWR